MRKVTRTPAPDFLTNNCVKWGTNYENLRKKNPSAIFSWATHKGSKVNTLLLPFLMRMTSILMELENAHCSFCDGFPVEPVSADSIEHFKPKSQFPLSSYVWENLFYCCSKCQQSKLENFDEQLLKPDIDEYTFEYFFEYDTKTGDIIPNVDRSDLEIERAKITIKLYGFNDHGRPKARKRTIRQFVDSNNPILDEFPYRFILSYLQ